MALTWSFLRLGAFAVLVAASAGLGFVIYDEIGRDSLPPPASPAAAPEPAPMPAPETFTLPPLPAYHAVTDRPVFTQNRKPPPAEDVASQPATNVSEFLLSGIIITESEKIALVTNARAGSLARYREGQVMGGWRLQSILQDRIVLERGAERQEIKLTDRSRATVEGVPQPIRPPGQPQPRPQGPGRR